MAKITRGTEHLGHAFRFRATPQPTPGESRLAEVENRHGVDAAAQARVSELDLRAKEAHFRWSMCIADPNTSVRGAWGRVGKLVGLSFHLKMLQLRRYFWARPLAKYRRPFAVQGVGPLGLWFAVIALFWAATAVPAQASSQAITYDAQGNLISAISTVALAPPAIVAQPLGQLAKVGARVSFSVVAAGTPPLAFVWRFNGNPISTAANPSAGTSTLVLNNLAAGDFGTYSVVVSNSTNTATSNSAALQLDSVGDGIPDSWKAANFGVNWQSNPNSAANADPDGDGLTNAEEYADGTDPNITASHFYRLTVAGGAVAVQPSAPRYAPGAAVTLTALPVGDMQLTTWSTQDLIANSAPFTTSANPLVLTMNTNFAVTALFGALPLERPAVFTPSFTSNNHNARAEYFLTQADGRIVTAGTFDALAGVPHSNLARLNTDDTLDTSFNPSVNNGIVSVIQQTDGKLVIGGYFSVVNGVSRAYLARLNSDGSLDTTFTANCDNLVRQISYRASDGKLMVVGGFIHVNSVLSPGVVRLNADGSVDGAFAVGSGANTTAYCVAWQPDGKAVIGGDFTSFNGTAVNYIARLTSTGTLDPSFIASADGSIYQIARRPSDGDLWVAGNFGTIDGVTRRGLARLRASDGSLDPSVNVGSGLVNAAVGTTGLALQADGKVVIGGNFAGYNGSSQYYLARVNPDGSLDAGYTFGGTGLDSAVIGVGLDSTGNTLIGGAFNFINGAPHLGLARLLAANGNLDPAFNVNASYYSQTYAIATQSNGATLVGGPFNVVNGVYRSRVARLNPDGTLDTAFNLGLGLDQNYAASVAAGADGKVVIGGAFTTVNGQPNERVARFNADGSLDSGFQSPGSTNNDVSTVAFQRDGKVLLGGYFTTCRGVQRPHVARLNADGTLDSNFIPQTNDRVRVIVVQPDTRILLAGDFTTCNGVATGSIARLNADGSLDATFAPPVPNNLTAALVLQPDGKILAGGRFTSLLASNVIANRVARLNSNGAVDPGFHIGAGYGANGDVLGLAQQSDGHIVLGGNFSAVNNTNVFGFARLTADGSLDTSSSFFQSGVNNQVFTVATQPSDAIVAGGIFTAVGDQPRLAYARFVTAATLLPGAITVSPPGPAFATGAVVTLSITPGSAGPAISGVAFEYSADGVQFQSLGVASPGAAGAWSLTGVALPPGLTFFRALVTDQATRLARSNLAGPFTTPPVVTSALSATAYAGVPFSFQVSASNPLTHFTATGLPAWAAATFDANLGALSISGTPNAPGVTSATLTPANVAGNTSTMLTLTVFNRFASWAGQNFNAAELNNPNLSGPSGDATGAGIANLFKYAFRIPPHLLGLPAGLPVAGVQRFNGIDYLTLTYTHDQSATDVALTVEVSTDLTTWNAGAGYTVEVSRTDNGNGSETVVTRDVVPQLAAAHRFIRLEGTQIAP